VAKAGLDFPTAFLKKNMTALTEKGVVGTELQLIKEREERKLALPVYSE